MPAIADVIKHSKYEVQMDLKAPDARVYGFLAWGRYSAIVPNNMYQTLDRFEAGHRHRPVQARRLVRPERPRQLRQEPALLEAGPAVPGRDQLQDHHRRAVADRSLKAGAIDGGVVSSDNAVAINGFPGLTVLHNLTAAFRELQMTIKAGEDKPWHDVRVRQAVNFAINRQNLIDKVYAGYGQYSGVVAAGYGPWVISTDQLKSNYEKYDLPTAKKLMAAAGSKGFDVTMTTFSTPTDFSALAALIKNDLAQIGINVTIVPQDPVTFGANNSAGSFDWDLTARGMRGDVDGYVAEYNPSAAIYSKWFTGWAASPGAKTKGIWKEVGNGRITLDTNKRLPMYHDLDKRLFDQSVEVGLISVSKFFVVRNHLKNVYVAFTDFNPGLRTAYLTS